MKMLKIFGVWMLLFGLSGGVFAGDFGREFTPSDTVILEVGTKSRIVIYLADKADRAALKDLDMNKLIAQIDSLLTASELASSSKNATINYELRDESGKRSLISMEVQNQTEEEEEEEEPKKKRRSYVHWITSGDLGLNNYTENGKNTLSELYGLDVLGSRYVAINTDLEFRFSDSPFRFRIGLQAAWNNYMFEKKSRILDTENGAQFMTDTLNITKSKLTVFSLNVPVMIHLRSRKGWRFGIGAYAGYRLDSYSKTVFDDTDRKDQVREHANFGLNDVRYGIRTEFGRRDTLFFFNYDISPLFKAGAGPELNAFSFGIKI